MGTFTERIRLILDVDSTGATKGFGGFKSAVADADGVTNKFKAGLGNLATQFGSFIKSPAGAATAVAAAGTAMFAAASEASDLGIRIGKLADSTGLSTEAASRWIEVGADMGIGADQIGGLIEKMTMNLGKAPEKFKAMGIEVIKAKDGTADMNATLLTAIERIDGIRDPTEKAKVAASLFGKSWADASELVGLGADKVQEKLEAVGDAKVFDEGQVADAREFRDQMEELKDVGEELATSIGKEILPAFVALAKGVQVAVGVVEKLVDVQRQVFGQSNENFFKGRDAVEKYGDAWMKLPESMQQGINSHGEIEEAIDDGKITVQEMEAVLDKYKVTMDANAAATRAAGVAAGKYAGAAGDLKKATKAAADAVLDAADDMREWSDSANEAKIATDNARIAQEKLARLLGTLDDDAALLNLKQQFDDLKTQAEDSYIAVAEGSLTAEEAVRSNDLALIALKKSVADYATEVLGLPSEQVTEIVTNLTPGNVEAIESKLAFLARNRNVNITVSGMIADSGLRNLLEGRGVPGLAHGTNSAAPGVTLVGEQGPELVMMGGGETVLTASQTRGALAGGSRGNTYVTINAANMSGEQIAQALANWERRNGRR